MPGTGNGSGQWVKIGDEKYQLIYSMLSLEKIEAQFGSVAEMQASITDDQGQVTLDRPVVKLLIDIVHAGLLHELDDTPAARRTVATGIRPAELNDIVEAFTRAFTDAFGVLGEQLMAEATGYADARPGRHVGPHPWSLVLLQPSSSGEAGKRGKPDPAPLLALCAAHRGSRRHHPRRAAVTPAARPGVSVATAGVGRAGCWPYPSLNRSRPRV